MIPSCSFSRAATGAGRTLSSRRSDFACSSSATRCSWASAVSARSRARTKYWSTANTVVATPRMVSAKNATTTPCGRSGAPAARAGSITAETTTRATKPRNQGIAWRAPPNTSAPSGDVTAHRQTAEELSNPPRLHCRANGSRRLMPSWLRRNSVERCVRANTARLTAVASW